MSFGGLPVRPLNPRPPIIAVDRWSETATELRKAYRFRRQADRNDFVIGLLAHESRVEHNARMTVDEETVELRLATRDVGRVTSVDREYARYADVLFKDIVYKYRHEDEG